MRILALLLAAMLPLASQTTTVQRRVIRATGEGVATIRPDLARLSFSVVTQAATAQDAAAANATRTSSLIAALRQILGANADIRTSGYNLSPTYTYPRDGGTPTLTGFTATNSIAAVVTDLAIVGRVIDAGIQAGANRVEGLSFGAKDEDSARVQALRLAGQNARAHAEAIAQGLNVRLGAVMSASESSAVIPVNRVMTTAVETTPVVTPGSLEVRATLSVEYEIAP